MTAPGPLDQLLYQRVLPCDDSAPRQARAWVRETLHEHVEANAGWHTDILADAQLCVSELVTASLIANSTAITLSLVIEPNSFRLAVRDDAAMSNDQFDPSVRAQLLGLKLLDALTDDSGIDAGPNGRELRAEFHANHTEASELGPYAATGEDDGLAPRENPLTPNS